MKYILTVFILMMPIALFGQERWESASSKGFTAREGSGSAVVNGKIYIIGGFTRSGPEPVLNTVEVFDPGSNMWDTIKATGTFTKRGGLTCSVVGEKIYAIGGFDSKNNEYLNILEVFDPSSNSWSTPATSGSFTTRTALSSSVVDGKIYAIGGQDSSFFIGNTFEVFDPSANNWSTPQTSGTFTSGWGPSSSVVNGKIYVIGGYNVAGDYLSRLEVFDPSTNTWTTPVTTGKFTPRAKHISCVLDDKIYVLGGENRDGYPTTVEVFDPQTNSWSTLKTTGSFTPREELCSSVIDRSIYVMGGQNDSSSLNINEVLRNTNDDIPNRDDLINMNFFPNPTTGLLSFRKVPDDVDRIVILNVLAKSVLEYKNPHTSDFTLDLSKLVSGTYYIRFSSANSVVTKKVIKN